MENRYFVPKREEVNLGYEFEMGDSWGGWIKLTMTEELLHHSLVPVGSGNDRMPWYWHMRVPYLTTEQIINEGWEHTGGKLLESAEQLFDKGNYMCSYTYSNSHIVFLVRDPSLVEDYYKDPTFRGECKDINTFRLICKLLNI